MMLESKAIVVTGGAQGIGREIALDLSRRGAQIVVADTNEAKANAVCQEIHSLGSRAIAVSCDVSSDLDCNAAVTRGLEAFGKVDGLVNNASIFSSIKTKPFWEIDVEEWDALSAVNLRGSWQMVKAALPALTASAPSAIVNISSSTFLFGRANYAHYVALKAGILGLTRAMARELGDRSIRVNAIAPGMIVTEIPRDSAPESAQKQLIANQCLKRAGRPQDIAGVVAFLLGADSQFVTGQLVVADGGYVMH